MSDYQKTVSVDLPATTIPGATVHIAAQDIVLPDRTVDDPVFSIPVGAHFVDLPALAGGATTLTLDGNYDPETIFRYTLDRGLVINLASLKPGQRVSLWTKQLAGNAFTGAFWDSRVRWQNQTAGSFTTGVGLAAGTYRYDLTVFECLDELVPGPPLAGLVNGRQVKNF